MEQLTRRVTSRRRVLEGNTKDLLNKIPVINVKSLAAKVEDLNIRWTFETKCRRNDSPSTRRYRY